MCNCHLCKEEVQRPYWIVDMKFCQYCYEAITKGDLAKLKNKK
jgi:hypothetical protein